MIDSRIKTYEHIYTFQKILNDFICRLQRRLLNHDQSKLVSPEKELFDEYTPVLDSLTYGTPEYTENLQKIKPALDHHYLVNSHHPEHYSDGISGMSMIDIMEMLADWKAATSRTKDGDIYKSIEINQARFGYSDELKKIMLNTMKLFENQ
jgi:hypothetical protein